MGNCCKDGKEHQWVMVGGRPCPLEIDESCHQGVYECSVCKQDDYGEPGGPGFDKQCANCYYNYAHKHGYTYHKAFREVKTQLKDIHEDLHKIL